MASSPWRCVAAWTLLAGSALLAGSPAAQAQEQPVSLGNKQMGMAFMPARQHVFSGLEDRLHGQALSTTLRTWYIGRVIDIDKPLATWPEESFTFQDARYHKADGVHRVTLRSQNADFNLTRQLELPEHDAMMRVRYTYEARGHFELSPQFTSPLLDVASLYDTAIVHTLDGKHHTIDLAATGATHTFHQVHRITLQGKQAKRDWTILVNQDRAIADGHEHGLSVEITNVNFARRIFFKHLYLQRMARFWLQPGQKLVADMAWVLHDRGDETGVAQAARRWRLAPTLQPGFAARKQEREQSSHAAATLGHHNGLTLWTESPWKKVYPETSLPTRAQRRIEIATAKLESESFQLALRPTSAVTLMQVRVEDLRHGSHTLSADHVELLYQHYQPFHSAAGVSGMDERIPDALHPLARRLPLALPANQNQPIWVTVHTPQDTPAGVYEGTLHLTWRDAQGQVGQAALPLAVRVRDFVLPAQSPFNAFGLFWRFFQVKDHAHYDGRDKETVLREYAQNAARYRIVNNHAQLGPRVERQQVFNGSQSDFSLFNQRMKDTLAHPYMGGAIAGAPYVYLSNFGWEPNKRMMFLDLPTSDPTFWDKYRHYVGDLAKVADAHGWFDHLFLKVWDEPFENSFDTVRQAAKVIREVDPRFRVQVTSQPFPELLDIADIICPGDLFTWYNADMQRRTDDPRTPGKQWWVYMNGEAFIPDQAASITRVTLWKLFNRGITGYYQWAMDYWERDFSTQGQAWLYHPSSDGPVPSIRLELFRDGIEDYMYFHLIQQRLADDQALDATARQQGQALLDRQLELAPRDAQTDYAQLPAFDALRQDAADWLEKHLTR